MAVVLFKQNVLDGGSDANGEANHEGDPHPLPHLDDLLFVRVAAAVGSEFLLVGNTGLDLFKSLRLHVGLGPGAWDGLSRSALDDSTSRPEASELTSADLS